MSLAHFAIVFLCIGFSYGDVYDYYTGDLVSAERLSFYKEEGVTDTCTVDIQPCSADEPRRVDGSCVSLKNPAKGTYFSPMEGVLPANYHNGSFSRLAQSGAELPLARTVRLNVLKEGKSPNLIFNHHLTGFGIFSFSDVGSVHNIENMLLRTTYCCEEEHWNDYVCTPNLLTADDPVHKFSGIKCMNSTRPLTYRDYKCTNDAESAHLKKATSPFDLSQIYNAYNKGDQVIRSFVKGQLTVEEGDGHIYPPSSPEALCPLNSGNETRCFKNYINNLTPITLYVIWFVRHHNYLASKLAELNPCWSDEKLFNVARNMNIAYYQQVLLYEWLSALEGRSNLIKAGIINKYDGFRDLYDEDENPEVTLEFTFCLRWFHLMQSTTAKFYDRYGNYIKDYPLLKTTFRTGFLGQGDNIEYFTQNMMRDGCRAYDSSIEHDFANDALPGVQRSLDVAAGDINKGRNLGVAPYVDYVKHFTGIEINCFDDLAAFIPVAKIEVLKSLFGDVKDIDLIVGLWVEEPMKGGHIPLTFASIINDNMKRSLKGDRHWYERPNRPDAFTRAQLKEIRKASIARLLCDVGDGISEVPRNAIYNISPKNPLVSCDKIKGINFSAWADNTCKSS